MDIFSPKKDFEGRYSIDKDYAEYGKKEISDSKTLPQKVGVMQQSGGPTLGSFCDPLNVVAFCKNPPPLY